MRSNRSRRNWRNTGFCVALSTGLAAGSMTTPSFAQGFLDSLKGSIPNISKQLGDMVTGNKPKNSTGDSTEPAGVSTAAGIVGILGVSACAQGKSSSTKNMLCGLGAVVAVEMTRMIGTKIADGLRESEQRKVLAAASDSLKTGEPSVVDLPESGGSVSVAAAGPETTKEFKVQLLVDASVTEAGQMLVVGQTQEIRGAAKLRSGPRPNDALVGTLKTGETVHVLGRVDDAALVSRWVAADGVAKPMGTGYVPASALHPSTKKDYPSDADVLKSVPRTKTVTVNAILTCRGIAFVKKDSKGVRVEDTSYMCIAPDGSPLSA